MSFQQIVLLSLCTFGIACGQILFKMGAVRLGERGAGFFTQALSSWHLWCALVIYGGATLLWVWLLREVPLTRAYPFMAMAFALVPLAGWVFLGEMLNGRYILGVVFIVAGIFCIVR